MLGTRDALWFGLRFAFLLSFFMVPWPRLGSLYSAAAEALGNLLLGDSTATLYFVLPDSGHDFSIELQAGLAAGVRVPIDLRTLAYIPTAMFLALTLATPIWKGSRGVTVLVLGTVVLHAFLVVSIAIPLVLLFAEPQPMHLLELGTTLKRLLDVVYRSLVAPPGMAYAIPILLWIALLWLIPDDRGDALAH